MGRAKPVTIAGVFYQTQSEASNYFKRQKANLYDNGKVNSGELFNALKELFERYCGNEQGWELNGRLVVSFVVENEKRFVENVWVTTACYKVHLSNGELRPFSIDKALKSISKSTWNRSSKG
ncbi:MULTISPECIES: hypothetical protein [Shewanella]|uniref:hypothetical protein n=1 Tax=Shewanella TaxID=22 RepID=UPI00138F83CD|nr:hypothetical protein [Shewanella sp. SE1]NDO76102.1 hypothetical protein [Shewanella sp. SE1]